MNSGLTKIIIYLYQEDGGGEWIWSIVSVVWGEEQKSKQTKKNVYPPQILLDTEKIKK